MPIVVSDSFARKYFPGPGSIGRHVRIGDGDRAEIIGVVSDTSSIRPAEPDEPLIYQPLYVASLSNITPVVQTTTEAASLVEAIRTRVHVLPAPHRDTRDGRDDDRPRGRALLGDGCDRRLSIRARTTTCVLSYLYLPTGRD
jgi:hypothetical protein